MVACRKMYARKAAWLAFGLVALAAIASTAQDVVEENSILDIPLASPQDQQTDQQLELSSTKTDEPTAEIPAANTEPSHEVDQAQEEATRAYKQAMYTLSAMAAHPSGHTSASSFTTGYTGNSISLFSSLLPKIQGKGPVGSVIRIINKLYTQIFREPILKLEKDGSRQRHETSRKAIKVIDLLQHSAELGNTDALFTVAKISLFPPSPQFPSDPHLAFDLFSKHASLTGNGTSQAYMAFFFSTGYGGVVDVDQAKAQLYYTFAANGRDKGAQMALGYRYWSGIGTLQTCKAGALDWYERAAAQAMDKFASGPPGGRTLPQTPTSLSDLVGGVYGPGASVASTGLNSQRPAIRAGVSRASGETWEDILDYYLFNADRGETDFAYRLGKIFYQGSIYASPGGIGMGSEGVGAIPRDFSLAKHYFEQIARLVWPRDPLNPLQHKAAPPVKEEGVPFGYAAASAGYLGRMYLRGEGVKADPAMAKMWFERGEAYGDRECHNGLGIIYRDGLLPSGQNYQEAVIHFKAAASQELAEAQVNLAKLYFDNGEIPTAKVNFEHAIRLGSNFEAYYYLGQIYWVQATNPNMLDNVATSSCAMAVSLFKMVAERGVWDDDLLREAEVAWMTGTDQSREQAMLKWWVAAERGSEVAQNNLAHVLDQDKSILRLTRFSPFTPSNDTARLALTQWTRAASQHNIDALVKVADYYYHGLGVPEEPEATRFEKAAKYYQAAADTQQSALAMWSLGWMYENGVGVPQDFHLAKRHYDMALETNSEAYLPVLLSLGKLYVKSIWHTLMGGEGGLSIWALEEEEGVLYHDPPVGRVQGLEGRTTDDAQEPLEDERTFSEDEEGPWYIGKARDEFHKRKHGGKKSGQSAGEEDPIEWAKNRRDAERERDSDFGPEDYFDAALRGGHRGEGDELSDTMLLVLLVLLVSVLIWFRTRMVRRMRHDQQQQQQQNGQQQQPQPGGPNPPAGNGLFPPAGDPARQDWAILR